MSTSVVLPEPDRPKSAVTPFEAVFELEATREKSPTRFSMSDLNHSRVLPLSRMRLADHSDISRATSATATDISARRMAPYS